MGEYYVQNKAVNQKNSSRKSNNSTVQARQSGLAGIIQMAKMNPKMLTQNDVIVLQRTIGNQAVCQMFSSSREDNNQESLQMKADNNIFQRREISKEKELVQMKKENKTGIPDNLKSGIENLSGVSMDDVKVHYNSDKPAKVGALAYTQGTEIHVGPGQEKHLPHETWHVIQQKQERVNPTQQFESYKINDDLGLEKEADICGKMAIAHNVNISKSNTFQQKNTKKTNEPVIQRIKFKNADGTATVKVTELAIVNKLHKFMSETIKQDKITCPPVHTGELFGESGSISCPPGGRVRDAHDIADFYAIMLEEKRTFPSLLQLHHGGIVPPNSFSQIGASMLPSTTSNTDAGLMDALVRPSDKIPKEVGGEGVSYKEMKESYDKIVAKAVGRTQQVMGNAYLSLLRGETPAGFDANEIAEMYYHLTILTVAEGRRDVGIFPFVPIALQNMADNKISFEDLFKQDEKPKEPKGPKGPKKPKEPKGAKCKDRETTFPSAWIGSKPQLELIEKHVASGKQLGENPTNLTAPKRVLDKMTYQIKLFFQSDESRDFTRPELKDVPGAKFSDTNGALVAIVNMIRDKFFSTIPAMYEVKPETPEPVARGQKRAILGKRKKLEDGAAMAIKNEKKADEDPVFARKLRVAEKKHARILTGDPFSDTDSEKEEDTRDIKMCEERHKKKIRKNKTEAYKQGESDALEGRAYDVTKYPGHDKEQSEYKIGYTDKQMSEDNGGYRDGVKGNESKMKNTFYNEGYVRGKARYDAVKAIAEADRNKGIPDSDAALGEDKQDSDLVRLYWQIYYKPK